MHGPDLPPEGEPRSGDEIDGDDEQEPTPVEDVPDPDEKIEDPLEGDTIKFSTDERILGVTLDGPKVGRKSIDVFTLGEFLAQLDRVVRALTAAKEGLTLAATGKIPRPPDAAPWRTRGVRFGNSATIDFVLGQPETTRMSQDGDTTSPTIEAVVALGLLVGLEPAEAVAEVRDYDDRIGTDFSALLGLLADNDLASRWEVIRTDSVSIEADHADRVRNALRTEEIPATGITTVTGFLFRLDAKSNDFKLQPEEGPPITGAYDESLVSELRDAWSHRVVAELTSSEHRYAYASRPHKVDYALKRIVKTLGSVEPDEDAAAH